MAFLARRSSFFAALVVVLGSAARAQTVWVVDDSAAPPSDFHTIQEAVDAASDGDLILVRPGDYGVVDVDARKLVVQADDGGAARVSGVRVSNLTAEQFVAVRGLRWRDMSSLVLDRNQGDVWLEDLSGAEVTSSIAQCPRVVLRDCVLNAHLPFGPTGGHPGLLVTRSSHLALYDCALEGDGGLDAPPFSIPAGAGLHLDGSTAIAFGGAFLGGPGNGGVTGPGALVLHVQANLRIHGTMLLGGPGASGSGPPYVLQDGGTLVERPEVAPRMDVQSPVREGQTVPMTFRAVPGETIHLLVSRAPGDWRTSHGAVGPRVLDKILFVLPMGVVPASGVLETTFTAPPIPGDFHSFYFQPVALDGRPGVAFRQKKLGAPTQVHLLDAGL